MGLTTRRRKTVEIPFEIELHPKQEIAFDTEATEVLYGGAAGGGKALALDTPIPTPNGWTTMGALAVGDPVFDEHGQPCKVVAATDVMQGRPCYRVTFCDGAEIVADADHQWITYSDSAREALRRRTDASREKRRARRAQRGTGKRPDLAARNAERSYRYLDQPEGAVVTTEEIAASLRTRGRTNHAVEVCAGLALPEAELPIPPYVLGVWLGDGTRGQGAITTADAQIVEEIEAHGFEVRKRPSSAYSYGVLGLQEKLKALGIIHSKEVPSLYLRASYEQRLELLRGLMDTDGTATKAGACEFDNCDYALIVSVHELLVSLGIKASIREGRARLNGKDCGPRWRLKFTTAKPVFRLDRKLARIPKVERGTKRWRLIKAAEPIASVPVRCIQVDSASHLFLAGREMIPTHNSHLMRVAAITWCAAIPGLQVYFFRRVREDLMKNHMEGPKGFRAMLAAWANAGIVKIIEDEIRFRNGSKIYLCHCKDPKDVYKYQGAEIHVLVVDELTHFLEDMYRFLRNRVRMVGLRLPPGYAGRFPRIMCSANPGNIGHLWVKRTWISDREPLAVEQMPAQEGGMLRQYIPARLDDNPSLTRDDPGYEERLQGLGSAALVKAMRDGDWNVVEGAFFDEWSTTRHVVKPFEIPKHWVRFRAMDWGSFRPFSVGWYAHVGEDYVIPGTNYYMPKGSLLRYKEWYGTQPGKDNVGLKMEVEAVGRGIVKRSKPETDAGIKFAYTVLDPSMFQQNGGPSFAERLFKVGLKGLKRGDNTRVTQKGAMGGWDMVRARLRGDGWTEEGPGPDWVPHLFVFETCTHLIRTLPVLQHDQDRPEDLDTDGEDHAADELRYAVMSRPYTPRPVEKVKRPDELEYTAVKLPDGRVQIVSNMSVMDRVQAKMRRKERNR